MTSHPSVTVFTPYYAASTPERQAELDLCLQRNLACKAIDQLVLLIDDGHVPPVKHAKLRVVDIEGRPTYAHWARLTRELARSGVSVLANSDIYFDETLAGIGQWISGPEKFLALSRYDQTGEALVPHPKPKWSQDVWAFHTQATLPPALMKALDIPLGVPRCDNKVAYLFGVNGWQVFNPLQKLRSIHVHETQQRNYDKKADLTVIGAVAYVHPTDSPAQPSQLEIDVWARKAEAIATVTLNRSLDNWEKEARRSTATMAAVTNTMRLNDAVAPAAKPAQAAAKPTKPATEATSENTLAVAAVVPASAGLAPAIPGANELKRAMTTGEILYRDALGRFNLYRHAGGLLAVDWLDLRTMRHLPAQGEQLPVESLLAAFIPPVLSTRPIEVTDRPLSPKHYHFWQYPAATERQALHNHLGIAEGANVDTATRTVHTYLGLPWATYIDKRHLPPEVLDYIAPRIQGLRRLAEEHGYRLAVHSVCQQIYWRRMVDTFAACGITDLHISHALKSLDARREGLPFRIHSWPLIAPNVENPARTAGLVVGKPIKNKRYLASFVGAHMGHYRSDVRLRLLEAAKASGRTDVLVDLGKEWHFNKEVYQEQVANKQLTAGDKSEQLEAARRYNEVLSDSVFSLCPEGAGPNTLRVWESLAAGSIPVILADDWLPPSQISGNPILEKCCIFMPSANVSSLFSILAAHPERELAAMQHLCIQAYRELRRRTCWRGARPQQFGSTVLIGERH